MPLGPAAAQQKVAPEANAAALYRSAFGELKQQFGDDHVQLLQLVAEDRSDYHKPDWRDAVARASDARALLQQAASMPACHFNRARAGEGAEPQQAEVAALAMSVVNMRHLLLAHAWQNLPVDPAATCDDASSPKGDIRLRAGVSEERRAPAERAVRA